MKKARILALLCAIVMIVSMAPLAQASDANRVMAWNNPTLLSNGDNLVLYAMPNNYGNEYVSTAYDEDGNSIGAIVFDCAGVVAGKVNVDWIQITATKQGFYISNILKNPTLKERTGTIAVTGPSYKATITIIQSGADQIVSMVRNKKKMTVTCKLGSAEFHCFRVYRYKVDEYGNWNDGTRVKAGIIKGSKITFNVAKGYAYEVEIGPARIQADWSVYLEWEWCAYAQMVVTKLTGTQQADYMYNTVQ